MKKFTLAGQTYRVGDAIRVKTPESGLVEANVGVQSYEFGSACSPVLVSSFFEQPSGCTWQLFITEDRAVHVLRIQMQCRHCLCGHGNNHPTGYVWSRKVEFRDGVFVSDELSDNYHMGKVSKLPIIHEKPKPTTGQLLLDL